MLKQKTQLRFCLLKNLPLQPPEHTKKGCGCLSATAPAFFLRKDDFQHSFSAF